jgi:hypothetical protein
MHGNNVSRRKLVGGIFVNTTYVTNRQERTTYMTVRRDRSGARIVLPSTADRWQGTAVGKAKLESLVTCTPNQLWIIVYSEQSHVEHGGVTHGNITSVVRMIVGTIVVMLFVLQLEIIARSNNTSCPELMLRIYLVKKYGNLICSGICRRLLHFVLKDMCMNRDVLYEDGNCPLTCPELLQFKNCGKTFSKLVRVDMICTDTYENWSAEYDCLMLHLQIVIKSVQLRTGGYSGR